MRYFGMNTANRRSPHGERGLKSDIRCGIAIVNGRSPHGERGLKFRFAQPSTGRIQVALLTESVD